MWVKLRYRKWNNQVVGHFAYCKTRQDLKDILERYGIRQQDVELLEIDGKDHTEKAGVLWN